MGPALKVFLFIILVGPFFRADAQVNAASCNSVDVQTAINSATEGQTVTIPAGRCTWTSGVTISGKGINIVGAGSSQFIAYSSNNLALATGTLSLTIAGTFPSTPLAISTGQTLTVYELGNEQNYMTGTVTSWNSGTGALVMNITSAGGTCGVGSNSNCARWVVATVPAITTTILNDYSGGAALFVVTEDTSFDTSISNIQFAPGTYSSWVVEIYGATGGQAVVIHDIRSSGNPTNPQGAESSGTTIEWKTDRGLVYHSTFDSSYGVSTSFGAVEVKDTGNFSQAWTSPSYWGATDTNGQHNVYVENNAFFTFNYALSTDDNARGVLRYNFFDNSGIVGSHGADTSEIGVRYFEAYDNVAVFNGYSNGTTFNLANGYFYMRGGSFIIYDNNLATLISTDYGIKPDVDMTVMNLERDSTTGPHACWGINTSGGADYYVPRQVGLGRVTGKGSTSGSQEGCSGTGCSSSTAFSGSTDQYTYVGDSEPAYIWGNTREPLDAILTDYGNTASGGNGTSSCEIAYPGSTTDTTANYIVAGRDYFNATTAKPGYSPYTYPHPLTQGSAPAAPTGLQALVN